MNELPFSIDDDALLAPFDTSPTKKIMEDLARELAALKADAETRFPGRIFDVEIVFDPETDPSVIRYRLVESRGVEA